MFYITDMEGNFVGYYSGTYSSGYPEMMPFPQAHAYKTKEEAQAEVDSIQKMVRDNLNMAAYYPRASFLKVVTVELLVTEA